MNINQYMESLNNLDQDNIGSWPLPVKIVIWVVALILAGLALYQFLLSDAKMELENAQAKEVKLMKAYESKAFQASNLEAYKVQMQEMEKTFGALLRQLPSDTEVPGLLEDISHTGLSAGLTFESIQLAPEVSKEFYVELPIDISVRGSYHAFGAFVSAVAALPRIVTLHDFEIKQGNSKTKELTMKIRAKTYRYKES